MNRKTKLTDTVLDNDEYFFRDNEMFRAQVDNPNFQIDLSINNDIENDTKRKKQDLN
jgi:hypothetical protein